MVKINFNDTALRHVAQHRAADREGRLLYRTSKDSYRERWFRLCGNLLFYFRTDHGVVADMSDPIGVLVLADCHVQMEEYGDRPFVFSVTFSGEDGRKHFFSGQSQQLCVQWVQALRECGYGELQTQLASLRLRMKELTGSDPPVESFKIRQRPGSGVAESAVTATKFYVDSSSGRRSPSMTNPIVPTRHSPVPVVPTRHSPVLVVPTRRAPSPPTQAVPRLIDFQEPVAAADSAQVHTAETKADWETFN